MKPVFYLLFAIILSVILSACENETDRTETFPISLYASEITQVSDIRLFINKTESFDKDTIERFTQGSTFFGIENIKFTESDTILFTSKDSIVFGSYTSKYSVYTNGQQFLFYSPVYTYFVDKWTSILKHRGEQTPIPPSSGYQYSEKEVRVGYGSYTDIELCLLTYKLSGSIYTSDGQLLSRYMRQIKTLNEFNEDFIQELGAYDTLAVQESRVRFIRKIR